MKIADVYASGILSRDEQISGLHRGTKYIEKQRIDGLIILTSNRFLFCKKPPGFFSKGLDLVLSIPWEDVMSVSTTGLLFKKFRLSIVKSSEISVHIFSCDNVKEVVDTILFSKNLPHPNAGAEQTIIVDQNGRTLDMMQDNTKKLR